MQVEGKDGDRGTGEEGVRGEEGRLGWGRGKKCGEASWKREKLESFLYKLRLKSCNLLSLITLWLCLLLATCCNTYSILCVKLFFENSWFKYFIGVTALKQGVVL